MNSAQNLLELLQNPGCWMDANGNILYLNAAWRVHLGLPCTRRDECGTWTQKIAQEDRTSATDRLQSALLSGRRIDFECRLLDAYDQSAWFLLSLQPQRLGDAGATDWLCLCTPIHFLKLRERELEARARMQTEMLNIGLDCIKLISTDGRLVHLNRAGHIALGVPESSRLGMEWLPLLPAEVQPAGARALAVACAGKPARFPGRSERSGHPPQYWDNMLTPVISADGRTNAILCVSREVTAEREARLSLQQSQERLTIAAHVGGLGIWDYDLKRDVLQCDESWYQIMGRDPQQPIHSIAEFRPMIHPEDTDRATETTTTAAELIASRSNYGIVFRIIRPNGEIRWVRSAACLLQDDEGVAARAVGFVIDITDVRRGELVR